MKKLTNKDIPRGWDKGLWEEIWATATKMTREELIAFWIKVYSTYIKDKEFEDAVRLVLDLDKEELMDILDELDKTDALELLKNFSENL